MRKLGQDIRDARLRRRIPTEILAQRASISRMTLYKVENGDENVSMGTYATILFVLGLLDRVGNLADATEDMLGRQLEEERLPKRIRLPRKKIALPGDAGAS
jgi:transcriptional regulator with XRE-family HTH domain